VCEACRVVRAADEHDREVRGGRSVKRGLEPLPPTLSSFTLPSPSGRSQQI
jgi:hypothetical protein